METVTERESMRPFNLLSILHLRHVRESILERFLAYPVMFSFVNTHERQSALPDYRS